MAVTRLRIFGQEDSRVISWQTREQVLLAPYAFFSKQSTGERYPETLHPYRSPFQRDRDRVLHSAAFSATQRKNASLHCDMETIIGLG